MKRGTLLTLSFLIAMMAVVASASAAESKTVFRAPLIGAPGTGSEAHGNAVFVFSDDGSQLTYKLVVNDLEKTTMAHIHISEAACSFNVPVLWLYPESPPPQLIPGAFNGLLGGEQRVVTSADLFAPGAGPAGISSLDDLRQAFDDGRAYVLVHTETFPPGEICGVIQ